MPSTKSSPIVVDARLSLMMVPDRIEIEANRSGGMGKWYPEYVAFHTIVEEVNACLR